jgi:hypothetical protein
MIGRQRKVGCAVVAAAALSAMGCEATCDNPGPALTCDAPTGGACYTIFVEGQWSEQRQALAPPEDAHFTVLYGAAHSRDYRMWKTGALASEGVEAVAEEGDIGPLQDEVEARLEDGTAGDVICGSRTDPTGTTATSVVVSFRHRYLSMVSMIAPSSDWFVGVRDLDLYDTTQRDWREAHTVPLRLYDAGTERDDSPFDLDNDDQQPAEPIAERHQQVFFDTSRALGTLHFKRVR